jgi:hypothetical protein
MTEESYYAAVESHFVARRGSPLFITPSEWQLVWKWEQAGIPLHVVKEGIDRVFERPRASQKVRKLGYCRQTVEAAFRRFREASLGGASAREEVDSFDPTARLRELAAELEALGSRESSEAGKEVERLAAEAEGRALGELEDRLAELERGLVDAAERSLGEAPRAALRREAEATLGAYRDRMPEKIYLAALESAYRRRLRSRLGLPTLTLLDR